MSQPDVLAVDELSLGLAPMVVADLARRILGTEPRSKG